MLIRDVSIVLEYKYCGWTDEQTHWWGNNIYKQSIQVKHYNWDTSFYSNRIWSETLAKFDTFTPYIVSTCTYKVYVTWCESGGLSEYCILLCYIKWIYTTTCIFSVMWLWTM